jgi:hypothetical protein
LIIITKTNWPFKNQLNISVPSDRICDDQKLQSLQVLIGPEHLHVRVLVGVANVLQAHRLAVERLAPVRQKACAIELTHVYEKVDNDSREDLVVVERIVAVTVEAKPRQVPDSDEIAAGSLRVQILEVDLVGQRRQVFGQQSSSRLICLGSFSPQPGRNIR